MANYLADGLQDVKSKMSFSRYEITDPEQHSRRESNISRLLAKQSSEARLKAAYGSKHGLSVNDQKNNSLSSAALPVGAMGRNRKPTYLNSKKDIS